MKAYCQVTVACKRFANQMPKCTISFFCFIYHLSLSIFFLYRWIGSPRGVPTGACRMRYKFDSPPLTACISIVQIPHVWTGHSESSNGNAGARSRGLFHSADYAGRPQELCASKRGGGSYEKVPGKFLWWEVWWISEWCRDYFSNSNIGMDSTPLAVICRVPSTSLRWNVLCTAGAIVHMNRMYSFSYHWRGSQIRWAKWYPMRREVITLLFASLKFASCCCQNVRAFLPACQNVACLLSKISNMRLYFCPKFRLFRFPNNCVFLFVCFLLRRQRPHASEIFQRARWPRWSGVDRVPLAFWSRGCCQPLQFSSGWASELLKTDTDIYLFFHFFFLFLSVFCLHYFLLCW